MRIQIRMKFIWIFKFLVAKAFELVLKFRNIVLIRDVCVNFLRFSCTNKGYNIPEWEIQNNL